MTSHSTLRESDLTTEQNGYESKILYLLFLSLRNNKFYELRHLDLLYLGDITRHLCNKWVFKQIPSERSLLKVFVQASENEEALNSIPVLFTLRLL